MKDRLRLACAALMLAIGAEASAQNDVQYNLPEQSLEASLRSVGRNTEINILIDRDLVTGLKAPALNAKLGVMEAMERLLKGSGLAYEFVNSNTIVLTREGAASSATKNNLLRSMQEDGSEAGATDWSQALRFAQSEPKEMDAQSVESGGAVERVRLEEIIVTAQKREQSIQDVPIPVSVLDGDDLARRNLVRLEDYLALVPGVNPTAGGQQLTFRGMTTSGADNPGVATTIDGTPLGNSTYLSGGYAAIDLDPIDMQRIEVLRGPQGTLFGASAVSGLINYVTRPPSLTEIEGRVASEAHLTENGSGLGHSLRSSFNAPLTDALAIRASGFVRHDDGFIKDVVHSRDDANETDSYGLRLAALWKPSADFSVTLNAIHQDIHFINPVVDPGTLEISSSFPGFESGTSKHKFTRVTADVRASLGAFDLISSTAYTDGHLFVRSNISGFVIPGITLPSADAAPYEEGTYTDKFSQELRAEGKLGKGVDWMVGAFYTKEKGDHYATVTSGDLLSGALLADADVYNGLTPLNLQEMAVFGNATAHFSDQFIVDLGARYSSYDQAETSIVSGTLAGGGPFVQAKIKAEDQAFTYSISPQFHISPEVMVYGRVATGYRVGGPNFNTQISGGPATFGPDRVTNFELGVKGDLFAGLMSVDASVYHIDWDNIQTTVRFCTNCPNFVDNAGAAKVDGAEFALTLRPAKALTLSGWVAYNNARISDLDPTAVLPAQTGDRLPFGPKWSANLSADYSFPVVSSLSGSLGGTFKYSGERPGYWALVNRTTEDAYTQLDLRAGLESERWRIDAFARNVTNNRAVLFSGNPETIIRPRTIGVSFSTDF